MKKIPRVPTARKASPPSRVSVAFTAVRLLLSRLTRRGGLVARCAPLMLVALLRGADTPAAEPPSAIRVVLDRNYPPYSFWADDGRLRGILVEEWAAWQKQTGIKVELHGHDWGEAVRRMQAGEFDAIDSIVETPARREDLDFTAAYAETAASIFFRREISGITDLASLRGFPVGVEAGDQHADKLKEAGITTLIPFLNYAAMIAAAKERKINVFVADELSAHYFLHKAGAEAEFRQSEPVFRDGLQRAVRKGNAGLLRAVEQGFADIPEAELKKIREKWFGRAIHDYERYLVYAGWTAVTALLLITGLIAWNRMLQAKVLRRTAALTESEQRFRQIAENIDEVVWLTSADLSKTLYVSPAYERVWGQSRESLYRDPRAFIEAIHPEDRPRAAEAIGWGRERGFDVQYRVVRPDGSLRWIRERGFPIRDEAERVYRVAGIAEDITARQAAAEVMQQAEDRMRVLIDTLPTLAWSFRPDGAVDFVNQRWLDYTGLSLTDVLANPTQALHPDDLRDIQETWREDIAAGRPYEAEMRLRRADGEHRWFLVRTTPLHDAQGNIVKWFGASVDIQDRREAEESVRRRKAQLRELVGRLHHAREEEAKRIARELHDDLGQQLTALRLQLDSLDLKLGDATPDQRAQIAGMHTVVNHTLEAVQTIAGELRLGQLDLLGLTAAIDWQLKEFSRRSGIRCEVTRLDEISDLSDAQNTAVYRILQEALTNIVRHAGANRVEVSLQADAHRLTLRVRDNGRGITPAEQHDRRAIGLLGMHERAGIVGGAVTITAGAGGGTTVLVTIPLQETVLFSV